MRSIVRLRLACVTAAALATGLSCDSATAPASAPPPVPIEANTVVADTLDARTPSRSYTIVDPASTSPTLVYAVALSGAVTLRLEDATHGIAEGPVSVAPGGPPLGETPQLQASEPTGGRLTITVTANPSGSHARFQLLYFLVSDAPEHLPAPFQVGDTVVGEHLETVGDVDLFEIRAQPRQDLVMVLEETGGTGRAALRGTILVSRGYGQLTETYAFTASDPHPTDRVQAPDTGSYWFEVRSADEIEAGAPRYQGAYRFWSYAVNRAPEHRPAAAPFDSVIAGESIDRVGDVDEFSFTPGPGGLIAAFYQATATSRLEIVSDSGTVVGPPVEHRADTALFDGTTGRLSLAAGRPVKARVVSYGRTLSDTGAYRLLLYAIDARPEHSPATLAPGDSVMTETIESPGDVDEFNVAVTDSLDLNVIPGFRGSPVSGTSLHAQLLDAATRAVLGDASAYGAGTYTEYGSGEIGQTGAVRVGPGHYIVRVAAEAVSGVPLLRGGYQLWLRAFSTGPERARDTLALGDTVTAEAIDALGDIDRYHFYAAVGQHVNVAFQGLGAAAPFGGFQAEVHDPSGTLLALLYSPMSSPDVPQETGRLDLPAAGWYTIDVYGTGWPVTYTTETGPYRLAIVPLGTAPETAGPVVAVGDSVTSESLDFPGDWDQFTLTTTPGRQLVGMLGTARPAGADPTISLLNAVTGEYLASTSGDGITVTEPVTVPASGQLAIAVYEAPSSGHVCYLTCGITGPYTFQVLPFDSLPETAPATYILGDTVTAEAVDRAGDVDVFTLSAAPGDSLEVFFRLRAIPRPLGSILLMEVMDAATGAALAPATILEDTAAAFVSAGRFAVPSSGAVRLRIRGGHGSFSNGVGTAPYAFYVNRS